MNIQRLLPLLSLLILISPLGVIAESPDYERSKWDSIHFQPEIAKAKDRDCLECHKEILDRQVREKSPAGVRAEDALAWYQTLDTYEGDQTTFHQRHLTGPLARRLMKMKCTTCHQGNEPREEAGATVPAEGGDLTLRKMVDPNTCLMCHGQMDYKTMGLPSPWHESRKIFGDSCMTCHSAIRTHRHKVNFLNAEEIEKAGQESSDSCYGCHGGRAWYRVPYPYPRHPWPGMAEAVPEWAKDRPVESDERFRVEK